MEQLPPYSNPDADSGPTTRRWIRSLMAIALLATIVAAVAYATSTTPETAFPGPTPGPSSSQSASLTSPPTDESVASGTTSQVPGTSGSAAESSTPDPSQLTITSTPRATTDGRGSNSSQSAPTSFPTPSSASTTRQTTTASTTTSSTPPTTQPITYTERQSPNLPVTAFADYHSASNPSPTVIAAGQIVQVSCRVWDPTIESANPDGWWYRIASSPWNNLYYATANTFLNGDPPAGPYTTNYDPAVPECTS